MLTKTQKKTSFFCKSKESGRPWWVSRIDGDWDADWGEPEGMLRIKVDYFFTKTMSP